MPSLRGRRPRRLSPEERKSLTHGDFWIPEEEREVYRRALQALNNAQVPFVVAGAYAIYEHTGIYRQTKDLDLFVEPSAVLPAAHALHEAGFVMRATLAVEYAMEPRLRIWVPVKMTESYRMPDETLDAIASYSNYRRFETNVRLVPR